MVLRRIDTDYAIIDFGSIETGVNTTKDGFYDASDEERVRHLQGPSAACFGVLEPERLPEPEGFGEFPLGLSQFVNIAGK